MRTFEDGRRAQERCKMDSIIIVTTFMIANCPYFHCQGATTTDGCGRLSGEGCVLLALAGDISAYTPLNKLTSSWRPARAAEEPFSACEILLYSDPTERLSLPFSNVMLLKGPQLRLYILISMHTTRLSLSSTYVYLVVACA
jgi:hypothetical protein